MMGLSCLSAFGVKALVSASGGKGGQGPGIRSRRVVSAVYRVDPRWRRRLIAAVCIGLVLLEFFPSGQTIQVTSYPAYVAASSSGTSYGMLVIPSLGSTTQFYLYQQTLNGIPVVDGKVSQLSQTLPSYMYSEPFLRLLSEPLLAHAIPDVLTQSLSETQLAPVVMSYFGIRYVLVQNNELNVGVNYTTRDPLALAMVTKDLNAALGPPIYSDNNTQLYGLPALLTTGQIESMAANGPIVLFGVGWSAPGSAGRVAAHLSTLLVYAQAPAEYTLQMAYTGPQVCIWNQNTTAAPGCGSSNQSGITTYGVELLPGLNQLALSTEGGGNFTVTSLRL
jgi:hypothetical protein